MMNRIAYNRDKGLVIIPKCASMSCEAAVSNWTFTGEAKTFFGLIRHPIDRWVSGIVQYYGSLSEEHDNGDSFRKRLVDRKDIIWFVDKGIHDIHTEPQIWHWQDIPAPQRKLFKFEDGVSALSSALKLNFSHAHKLIDPNKIKMRQQVKKIIQENTVYKNKLLKQYSADLDLWASI